MPTNSKKKSNFVSKINPKNVVKNKRTEKPELVKLAGVKELTKRTWQVLKDNRKFFLSLAVVYALAVALLVGVASESTYSSFKNSISSGLGSINGAAGEVLKAGFVSMGAFGGGVTDSSSSSTQFYSVFLVLMAWLTIVWSIRNILAKQKFKMRDALYNSGSPILPTFLVAMFFLVDLLPMVVGIIIYSAAESSEFMSGILATVMVMAIVFLLFALSIYWILGTLLGLAVVSLPGMYPMQAIKNGNRLAAGRRSALVGRLAWLLFIVMLGWLVFLTPLVLFDNWLKGVWGLLSSAPFIPILIVVLGSMTVVWVFSYLYLLYREVVDNETDARKS